MYTPDEFVHYYYLTGDQVRCASGDDLTANGANYATEAPKLTPKQIEAHTAAAVRRTIRNALN